MDYGVTSGERQSQILFILYIHVLFSIKIKITITMIFPSSFFL